MNSIFTYILLGSVIVGKLTNLLLEHYQNKKTQQKIQKESQILADKLIKEREERTLMEEFDETNFWKIMSEIEERSKNNFKHCLGVFKDYLINFNSEEPFPFPTPIFHANKYYFHPNL